MARVGKLKSKEETSSDLTKEVLLGAVSKYAEYVHRSKDIDNIFDKNKDGVLSHSELKNALRAHKKKADRSVKRIQTKLFIDDKDIDFIFEQSNADNSGAVSHSELLPAVAAWEELAAIKIKKKKNTFTIS